MSSENKKTVIKKYVTDAIKMLIRKISTLYASLC